MQKTLVVIGGGAAGFFCAVNAATSGIRVLLLEKTGKLLSKVKISGGGRCNVTHACNDIQEMASRYPRGEHFLRKSFHHFFTQDTISWFGKRGVKLKTEADGRMFPITDSSQTIIDCLLAEADAKQVTIRMNAGVTGIKYENNRFVLKINNEETLAADYICIASGGYPKPEMYGWLHATGHKIISPVPSLFTFNLPGHPIRDLMGVTAQQVKIKVTGSKLSESGPLLITHWGLSGPAVLKLSAWGARLLSEKNWHFSIQVNWFPEKTEESLRESFVSIRKDKAAQKLGGRNPFSLSTRLWEFLLKESGIDPETRWAELPAKEQNRLIKNIAAQEFEVKGKTTFKEEFVTAGGIDLKEVDPATMMSRKTDGLYIAGEALDIDGITGGFNFQNAWTTGYIAAASIRQNLEKQKG